MVTVGIDLGTTNTVCCLMRENGEMSTVKFNSKPTLPSALLYERNKVYIGNEAKVKSVIKSDRYIESSKTFMGSLEPLKIIDGREFTPTDVASEILKKVKTAIMEQYNCSDEIKAVITVPAYFESSQKRETRKAGEEAGFIVDSIIHEPSAAALAYASVKSNFRNVYVVDIGGGTFDVAFIEKNGESYDEKIVSGDSKLGGDDFNKVIYDMILRQILEECGVNLNSYQECTNFISREETYLSICQKLRNISEEVKICLSSMEDYNIGIPALFINELTGQPYSLDMTITREMFEEKSSPLFDKIENIIRNSFTDENKNHSGYSIDDVDLILFMGGSSNIPRIAEIVYDIFEKRPESSIDVSKGVANGAALVCYNNENSSKGIAGIRKMEYKELLAHSIGTSSWNNRRIPGKFSEILKQGSAYPVSSSSKFTTISDNQTSVKFDIIEGNNKYAVDNKYYASFSVNNLTQRARGETDVEVTYSLDNDGILHISAKEIGAENNNISLDVNISESQENPLKKKFSEKCANIFMFNTSVSQFKELDNDHFKSDFIYKFMDAAYSYLCMFENPSVIVYNGEVQKFTTDPEKLLDQFEDYYSDNILYSNYDEFDSNIECIKKMLKSCDGRVNIFVFSDMETHVSDNFVSDDNVNIYYLDYNYNCNNSYEERYEFTSINELGDTIYKICSNELWDNDSE